MNENKEMKIAKDDFSDLEIENFGSVFEQNDMDPPSEKQEKQKSNCLDLL